MVVLYAIYYNTSKTYSKPEPYRPNQKVYLSDTTGNWEDNFDSSFVYNGCLHLTNKKR